VNKAAGAAGRTLELLACIAAGENEFTLKDIAGRARLAPSTTHRLLELWVRKDLLLRIDPGTYQLGPALFQVCAQLTRKFEISLQSRPVLKTLWDEFQETCVLCLYHPSSVTATVGVSLASPHPLKYDLPVQSGVPLGWGSLGRSILAHLPAPDVDTVLARERFGPISKSALPPRSTVLRELALIRKRGYATYRSRTTNIAGVSAAVLLPDGRVAGSVGVVMPTSRLSRAMAVRLPAAVLESAARLADSLPVSDRA